MNIRNVLLPYWYTDPQALALNEAPTLDAWSQRGDRYRKSSYSATHLQTRLDVSASTIENV